MIEVSRAFRFVYDSNFAGSYKASQLIDHHDQRILVHRLSAKLLRLYYKYYYDTISIIFVCAFIPCCTCDGKSTCYTWQVVSFITRRRDSTSFKKCCTCMLDAPAIPERTGLQIDCDRLTRRRLYVFVDNPSIPGVHFPQAAEGADTG